MILIKDFKQLVLGDLVSHTSSLLKLTVLLAESLIESWDLYFVVIHERLLLLQDDLIELAHKVFFARIHSFLALRENLAHELRKIL